MKKSINSLLITLLLVSACSKAPWESYQSPVDPTAQNPQPEPEPEPEPQPEEKGVLRVLSIGIHHSNANYTGLINLINTEKADLVVLREVDKNNNRTGISINQAEVIAEGVGMQYVFAPQLDPYQGGQFGLAVLSKWPIEDSWVTKLPVVAGGDPRPLAYIKVNYEDDVDIAFFGLHLDDGSNRNNRVANRNAQINALLNHVKDVDLPTVVAGNFFFQNTGVDMLPPVLFEELSSPCTVCLPTVFQHNEDFVMDHVLYKNISKDKLINFKVGIGPGSRKPAIAEFKLINP